MHKLNKPEPKRIKLPPVTGYVEDDGIVVLTTTEKPKDNETPQALVSKDKE